MNQYEVMYIIDTALEDQARADQIERFSALVASNGGQVDRIDEWGKRRLAYPINYKTDGYYVLMYMTAPPELPKELERNFKITEAILRYLVIRFEGELPPKREPLRPSAVPAQEAAPAPADEAAAPAEEAVTPVEESAAPAEEAAAPIEAPAEAADAAETTVAADTAETADATESDDTAGNTEEA